MLSAPVVRRYAPRAEGVRSVALDTDGKRIVFAANGALFTQPLEGVMARALVVPEKGWALSGPAVVGGRVVALAVSAGAPSFARYVVVDGGPRASGNAFGIGGGGRVVVLDVVEGKIRVIESDVREVCSLACAQDPMTPGVVAVRDDGKFALVMQAKEAHADATLVKVNLEDGSMESVHALAGPGWVVGGFAGERVVVCEQRLGDEPRFTVRVDGKVLLETESMQQPCAPVEWNGEIAMLLGNNGEMSMHTIESGAICPASGTRLRVEGEALVVEGGREALKITR